MNATFLIPKRPPQTVSTAGLKGSRRARPVPAGREGLPLREVWSLARPQFWGVSLFPYYVGFLLATHRLVPHAGELPRLLAGALVIGPLIWLAVLAINDAYDLPGDRLNPRKRSSPLVTGRLSVRQAFRVAHVAGALSLAAALAVGPAFALGTLLALVLGWLYSIPPVRLKARPGFDVAVNALAIGALGPVAGWSVMAPVGEFPWVMAVQGTLAGAALYIPTTLMDHAADSAVRGDARYTTVAVRFGPRLTYRIGLAFWVASAVLSAVLAAGGWVIPRQMLVLEMVMIPALVIAYHRLLRKDVTFDKIMVVGGLFMFPGGTFALSYVGVL